MKRVKFSILKLVKLKRDLTEKKKEKEGERKCSITNLKRDSFLLLKFTPP